MNSSLTTLDRPSSALSASSVLSQNGFKCTLLTFESRIETALPASLSTDDQLLFVVEGQIRVGTGEISTIIQQGGAFLLSPGTEALVNCLDEKRARVLRVEIPPRQIITPQIITPRT